MSDLEKLLGLVASDKQEEAKKLATAITAKIDGLDKEVSKQEGMKLGAVKTRDEIKGKLKEVASQLGVGETDNVTEAIEAIKSKKSGGKSEDVAIKDKEIEQLKEEIANANSSFEKERSEHKAAILGVALEKDIATILPKYKAKANATNYIIDAVKKTAQFVDGKIVFKNEDGTTLRANGNDATLDDVIKQMQAKEKETNESMFFDISPQASGAGSEKGGTKVEGDFIP